MAPRDPKQEREIMEWIEAVMGEPLPKGPYEEVGVNYITRRIVHYHVM